MNEKLRTGICYIMVGLSSACASAPPLVSDTAPLPAVQARGEGAESPALQKSARQELPVVSVAEDFLTSLVAVADLSRSQKGKLDVDSRKRLRELSTYVDIVALSQRSLGKRWATLPKSQREEFIATLTEILEEVVYPQAVKISAKSDEFTYKSDPKSPKIVLIHGAIEREKMGELISNPFEMKLEFDVKTKKVIDAVIEKEAISANLKRQFDRALEKRNFSAIIDLMKKRVAKARSGVASGA